MVPFPPLLPETQDSSLKFTERTGSSPRGKTHRGVGPRSCPHGASSNSSATAQAPDSPGSDSQEVSVGFCRRKLRFSEFACWSLQFGEQCFAR